MKIFIDRTKTMVVNTCRFVLYVMHMCSFTCYKLAYVCYMMGIFDYYGIQAQQNEKPYMSIHVHQEDVSLFRSSL